jgi:two-component system, cell cycle sensor histidine kinase and response regulator CckA
MWAQTTEALEERVGWGGDVALQVPAEEETILLVEDEAFVREVTSEVLHSAGYRVLAAKNAVEADRLYSAYRDAQCGEIGLLLTDVVLPGESGRELSRRLRRENPGLKTLLVSGYVEQLARLEAEREEFLAKPFSTEALLRRVKHLLQQANFPVGAEALVMRACSQA